MSQKIQSSNIRDLALRLLAYEATARNSSEENTAPVVRVSEKLRRPLSALAGASAFRVLLARALILAKAQVPTLSAVQVQPDGSLDGLSQVPNDQAEEGGVMLIAHLIGLLVAFIGNKLTLHMVLDLWPDLPGSISELQKESEYDPTR